MSDITTAQIVGWSVTVGGVLISLVWNLINTWRSNGLAATLRIEQYHYNQWVRIRDRIEKAMDELVDASRLAVRQAQNIEDAGGQIDLFNMAMVDAQDALASALEDADASEYCSDIKWSEAAVGTAHGSETSWDLVLKYVGEAQAASDKPARVAALGRLRDPIAEIRAAVSAVCRIQDRELDPNKL